MNENNGNGETGELEPIEIVEPIHLSIEKRAALYGLTTKQIEEQIQQAESSVELYKRMLAVICKATFEVDWIKFGSAKTGYTGYLTSNGALRLLRGFPVSFSNQTIQRFDLENGGFRWIVNVQATYQGRSLQCTGIADSNKKFYSMAHGRRLTIEEIREKESNIIKEAVKKAKRDGIVTFLGIEGLPIDQLEQFGVHPKGTVEFKTEENGTASSPTQASTRRGVISEPQAKRLFAIAKSHGIENNVLKAKVKEIAGVEHTRDIEIGFYEQLCTWAETFKPEREPGQDEGGF